MERVLPSDSVKKKIAALAVGLAADCDAPPSDVSKILHANLKGASTLPFVGLVAHDGTWVAGYSGFKNESELLAVLEQAAKSPALQASSAGQKTLAGLAERAAKSAEREDWKGVVKAANDASKVYGRCPERAALQVHVDQAHAWAEAKFAEAIRLAQSGGDLTEARKLLSEVKRNFGKEPQGDDADTGSKALRKLGLVRKTEERNSDSDARAKARAEYEGTRWTAAFDTSGAPAEEPPADETPEDE